MEALYVDIRADSAMYADYLRHIFPPEREGGLCRATVSHPIGALILSFLRKSDIALQAKGDHIVRVSVPQYGNAAAPLANHWLYITGSDMIRLNLAVRAEFEIDFKLYYLKGQELGMMKKDIVEAFILSRGLVSRDCFDALHKRVYRQELGRMERIRQKLLRKLYYIEGSVDTEGLQKQDKL